MTGQLANKLEDKADRETFEKTGVAPSRNMMNKIMGGVNLAAGAYGGTKVAGKIGGGDGESKGGITDFAKSFITGGNPQQSTGSTFYDTLGRLGGQFGSQQTTPAPTSPIGPSPSMPSTGGAELPQPNLSAAVQRGRNRAHAY
jgi:hypothetical protein